MATKKIENQQESYAVIELGGHQYLVKVGDKIKSEKLPSESGEKIVVSNVLLVSSEGKTQIGTPFVDGASVELMLNETVKGEKLRIAKFRAKSRYRRVTGHRQLESHLTGTDIMVK